MRDQSLTKGTLLCSPAKAYFVNVLPLYSLCSPMLPRCSPMLPAALLCSLTAPFKAALLPFLIEHGNYQA